MKNALLLAAFSVLSVSTASQVDTSQEPLSTILQPKNTIIDFDDIPTLKNGTDILPEFHHSLSFTNLSLLNPSSALKSSLLHNFHEQKCATSNPNALFSSNYRTYNPHYSFKIEPPLISSIYLNTSALFNKSSDSSSSSKPPLAFNLISLSLSPLGLTPPHPHEVKIHLRLSYIHPDSSEDQSPPPLSSSWSLIIAYPQGKATGYNFNFRDDPHPSLPAGFGTRINRIDIWAISSSGWNRHGSPGGGSNWGWCLDDLGLEWIFEDDEVIVPPSGIRAGEGGEGEQLIWDLR